MSSTTETSSSNSGRFEKKNEWFLHHFSTLFNLQTILDHLILLLFLTLHFLHSFFLCTPCRPHLLLHPAPQWTITILLPNSILFHLLLLHLCPKFPPYCHPMGHMTLFSFKHNHRTVMFQRRHLKISSTWMLRKKKTLNWSRKGVVWILFSLKRPKVLKMKMNQFQFVTWRRRHPLLQLFREGFQTPLHVLLYHVPKTKWKLTKNIRKKLDAEYSLMQVTTAVPPCSSLPVSSLTCTPTTSSSTSTETTHPRSPPVPAQFKNTSSISSSSTESEHMSWVCGWTQSSLHLSFQPLKSSLHLSFQPLKSHRKTVHGSARGGDMTLVWTMAVRVMVLTQKENGKRRFGLLHWHEWVIKQ